jgi:pyrroloquinoline-quinone synthase
VRSLEAIIRERHLLKHPFYVAWSMGEVERSTLQAYAGQYYQFERNFPRYVAGAYGRVEDPAGRRTLLENLVDEEGRDPTHPELWLRFAEAIGTSRTAVTRAQLRPETRALLTNYERYTLHGTAPEALSALYAYESIFPEVAAEKARGLRAYYGVKAARGLEFFRVHTEADVAHSRAERALLVRELKGHPTAMREAERATAATVGAWWRFLDAFTA